MPQRCLLPIFLVAPSRGRRGGPRLTVGAQRVITSEHQSVQIIYLPVKDSSSKLPHLLRIATAAYLGVMKPTMTNSETLRLQNGGGTTGEISPSSHGASVQDAFLDAFCRAQVPVFVFLLNGVKLQGYITSFDKFTVSLKNTATHVVYKHAISTVVCGANTRSGAV